MNPNQETFIRNIYNEAITNTQTCTVLQMQGIVRLDAMKFINETYNHIWIYHMYFTDYTWIMISLINGDNIAV